MAYEIEAPVLGERQGTYLLHEVGDHVLFGDRLIGSFPRREDAELMKRALEERDAAEQRDKEVAGIIAKAFGHYRSQCQGEPPVPASATWRDRKPLL